MLLEQYYQTTPKSLNLEKFAGTSSSLQKNKTKLFFICIIKTFEYLNSFTISQNTHIKKIL